MNRIENVSTPVTMKTFRTSSGEEYVLKGVENPVKHTDMGGIRKNESNYLKLYKKQNVDGLDTFSLVSQKEEKVTFGIKNEEPMTTLIRKERFNSAGALVEQAEIAHNVGGGKTIMCNGDVFKMSGNVATNSVNNTPEVQINFSKGKLSPIAKRILKILSK